jgi:hypothetical protein
MLKEPWQRSWDRTCTRGLPQQDIQDRTALIWKPLYISRIATTEKSFSWCCSSTWALAAICAKDGFLYLSSCCRSCSWWGSSTWAHPALRHAADGVPLPELMLSVMQLMGFLYLSSPCYQTCSWWGSSTWANAVSHAIAGVPLPELTLLSVTQWMGSSNWAHPAIRHAVDGVPLPELMLSVM